MQKNKVRLAGLQLATVFVIGCLLSSCGNKTFPKPIRPEAMPQISAVSAKVKDAHVLLDWTLSGPLPQGTRAGAVEFAVNRADVDPEKDCRECPPATAERVAVIEISQDAAARTEAATFSWTDVKVESAATYRYQVILLDRKQRPLGRSETVQATVLPPPGAPNKLTATANAEGILLQWEPPKEPKGKYPAPAQLRFTIERSSRAKDWAMITAEPIKGSRFMDATVADGWTYNYRVTSLIGRDGVYVWGRQADRTGIAAHKLLTPPPPQTVWVIPDQGNLQVYWSASDGPTQGYHIYRKHNGEIARLTLNPVESPPFLDDKAEANAIYSYAVSAVSPKASHEEGLLSKWTEFRNITFE